MNPNIQTFTYQNLKNHPLPHKIIMSTLFKTTTVTGCSYANLINDKWKSWSDHSLSIASVSGIRVERWLQSSCLCVVHQRVLQHRLSIVEHSRDYLLSSRDNLWEWWVVWVVWVCELCGPVCGLCGCVSCVGRCVCVVWVCEGVCLCAVHLVHHAHFDELLHTVYQ